MNARGADLASITDDPREVAAFVPPAAASVRVRSRWALQVAQLAPSIHNTQPWRWALDAPADGEAATVRLRLDPERVLPALDPSGRQLTISCGCALGALRVGAEAAGLASTTVLVPHDAAGAGGHGALARVVLATTGEPAPAAALARLAALRERRSARGWFTGDPIPVDLAARMVAAAAAHGVTARMLHTEEDRDALERLVALATLEQMEGEQVPAEVRAWTREPGDPRRDGVPAAAWERTSEQTASGAVILRDFAQERAVPGAPSAPEPEWPPALLLLSTPDDGPVAHLETGRALLDVLLSAQAAGVAVGHVNQAIEDPATRLRLGYELGVAGTAQLLLRLGYPRGAPPPLAPRRPLAEVLEPGGG